MKKLIIGVISLSLFLIAATAVIVKNVLESTDKKSKDAAGE